MTDYNEELLTAAKLYEQVQGRLEGDDRLLPNTGLISDPGYRSNLSFVENTVRADDDLDATAFGDTALGSELYSSMLTDEATEAIHHGNDLFLSHLVGLTEQDLDGSTLRLVARLQEELANNDAPAFILGAGNPNTGKTNTMSLLAELRSIELEDYLILSNVRSWSLTDRVVTSAHDLAVALLEERDRPKFVMIDEASTHFDARTNRREVATQWTPLGKRFAKIGVDACGLVVHTGKDCHPEAKRLATLAYWKEKKRVAEFFERWPADADRPVDSLLGGSVEDLESTGAEYDPGDAAPWNWDLEPELFTRDLDWSALLSELRDRGPAGE
jgi:hypothetical protein